MAPTELDLTLYLVTDSSLLPPNATLADHVRASIKGGVTIVQLREKNLQTAAFIKLGKEIHAITRELGVPLLINDRVDVAMAVGCEGVHIGWEDMGMIGNLNLLHGISPLIISTLADYKSARDLLGPDAIIGLSVSNHDQLALALEAGPTYLGLGPVYATTTKPDHGIPLRISGLRSLMEKIPAHIPTVAIGGISHANLQRVLFSTSQSTPSKHLDGVAIASAIITSTEPEKTCLELQNLMKHLRLMLGDSSNRSQPIADLVPELLQILEDSRKHPPLVHHITNSVSSTLSANVTLAIGASPIMSENPAEFEDLAVLNNGRVALVLNMGTFPDETKTKSMFLKALAAHNKFSNPVVFDPVGCGATAARRRFARAILEAGQCDVIKGNEGEILSIAGEKVNMRGVDGAGLDGGKERERELAKVCSELARSEGKSNLNP